MGNKIAILGVGVVGSALRNYLEDTNKDNSEFRLFDPPRQLNDDISGCDIAFISVPVATLRDRSQDLSHVDFCLSKLQDTGTYFNKPVIIKSTILPGTTDYLAKKYMMRVIHMPEFLTERTADRDMFEQTSICGGRDVLNYEQIQMISVLFPGVIFMRNKEAELAKYAHNCFGALKVSYFNIIKEASDILGAEYETVMKGVFASGYINKTHTQVPGPDGRYGFGGKCFPKDLQAFIGWMREHSKENYLGSMWEVPLASIEALNLKVRTKI